MAVQKENKTFKKKQKPLFGLILTAVLFVLVSYFIQTRREIFSGWIVEGPIGMITYVLIHIFAIVFAPFTAFPLISLASGLWGWVFSAFLTMIGWMIGSTIAFLIARKWGVPIVSKFVSLRKIHKMQEKLSIETGFWHVLFLRILLPGDLLSYALGLFSTVSLRIFLIASLIGLFPFALAFAYLGSFNLLYQSIFMLALVTAFAIVIFFKKGLLLNNG